ncbi:MAG: anti-sigma factor family protein [Actinomycetota bacterium]
MRCNEAREMLPAYVKGEGETLSLRRHLTGCGPCSTELVRYQALTDGLRSLAAARAQVPAGLKPALLAIPTERAHRAASVKTHVTRNRTKYAGGLAVAVVGAAIWASRGRRAAAA